MYHQLEQYSQLLVAEKGVRSGRIAVCGQNDRVFSIGPTDLKQLACSVLRQLDCTAIVIAEPLYPFPDLLIQRSPGSISALIPRDSESKSSLHDIPIIRSQDQDTLSQSICQALHKRKGCLVEGIGMVSQGSLTVEQAYISWSSLLHATTIKYFEDLLEAGPLLEHERDLVEQYKTCQLKPLDPNKYCFSHHLPELRNDILEEMNKAGLATVELGLVDSFFGNISYATTDALYISQTSARLDELKQQIDTVPVDESTTAGLTASSELPAHRAIIKATGCKAILHGHPRFPVVMSFFSTPSRYEGIELLDDEIPVVGGEGGVGGLADNLSNAFIRTGTSTVIARGHGVFTISKTGFAETLRALADIELRCRYLYFKQLYKQYQL